jgi:predicted small metal-binding protein
MKKFRCADIVPGCNAAVRAKVIDEVVAQAGGHLTSVHGLAWGHDLSNRVRQHVISESFVQSLLRRS